MAGLMRRCYQHKLQSTARMVKQHDSGCGARHMSDVHQKEHDIQWQKPADVCKTCRCLQTHALSLAPGIRGHEMHRGASHCRDANQCKSANCCKGESTSGDKAIALRLQHFSVPMRAKAKANKCQHTACVHVGLLGNTSIEGQQRLLGFVRPYPVGSNQVQQGGLGFVQQKHSAFVRPCRVVGAEAQQGGLGFVQQKHSGFVQPYLVVSIKAQQGGRQLGVSVHNVVHLDIWREGANVVVLDAAQLQIKESLQQQQGFI